MFCNSSVTHHGEVPIHIIGIPIKVTEDTKSEVSQLLD